MEIPDKLIIDGRLIRYAEQQDGTQSETRQDTEYKMISFNSLKRTSHGFFNLNPQFGRRNYNFSRARKWLLFINTRTLFESAVFRLLKQARTFEGIKSPSTSTGNIDSYMRQYIKENIAPRMEFSSFDLYVRPVWIFQRRTFLDARFNPSVRSKSNLTKGYSITERSNTVLINYTSPYDPRWFNLDYYFNITYRKI